MEPGRRYNKSVTSTMSGVDNTGAKSTPIASIKSVQADTASQNPHYLGEDESKRTMSGANDGYTSAPTGEWLSRWGHVTSTGTGVQISGPPGNESISIAHASGAGVVVEPDGSVFIVSDSTRGAGISAPKGDVHITAGGEIVITGPGSISIKTAGDLTLDVGGTLNMMASAIKTSTKILDENIDGTATRHVTQDQSVMVGGINRITVAGDQREQITGESILDVGKNLTERIKANNDVSIGASFVTKVGADTQIHSKTTTNIASSQDISIQSATKVKTIAGSDIEISSTGKTTVAANADAVISAGAAMKVRGASTTVSADGVAALYAGGPAFVSGSLATITGSTIGLATGIVEGPVPAGSATPVTAVVEPKATPATATAPTAPADTEVTPAEDIVDSMTSARKYPDYPGNGVREHANATNYGRQSHDTTDQAEDVFNEYSSKNDGNVNPSTPGDSVTTLPETPVDRDPNIKATDPGMTVPARHNNSAKISKYFTLGELVNAKHSHTIPASSWQTVVQAHILAATNVLDPIKEKFPGIIITSAYRKNSSNHITGRAIDLVVSSRSLLQHAEIARFARDKLPVDQVFLERNTSGRTHVHLRVSSSGSGGSPSVLTCGDPQCRSKTPGINVEWLQRRK